MDTKNDAASTMATAHGMQIFGLGADEYAIDAALVREIRGYGSVTRMAHARGDLQDCINLRGVIVPLLDLRIEFGLDRPSYGASTVTIIVQLRDRLCGIVVDRVADVVRLPAGQIEPAPPLSAAAAGRHVRGMGTLERRPLVLVDVAALLERPGLAGHPARPAA